MGDKKLKYFKDNEVWINRARQFFYFIVFALTYFQVFIGLINYFNDSLPPILTGVYVAFIVILPISTGYDFIASANLAQLLLSTGTLVLLSIYILFTDNFTNTIFTILKWDFSAGKLRLFTLLLIIVILIFATFSRFTQRKKPGVSIGGEPGDTEE